MLTLRKYKDIIIKEKRQNNINKQNANIDGIVERKRMSKYFDSEIKKSPRIAQLVDDLYDHLPVIESDRARLLTESYQKTENEPIILRRAKAFLHICKQIPITIRRNELIVGSATKSARGCQVFPEFSYTIILVS